MMTCLILATSLFFSTSTELKTKAKSQVKLQRQEILIENFSKTLEGMLELVLKDLRQDLYIEGVEAERVAKIVEFRQKTAKQLEKEQAAWLNIVKCYSNCYEEQIYCYSYRLKELKRRFPAVFNKQIKMEDVVGQWESNKIFDRKKEHKFEAELDESGQIQKLKYEDYGWTCEVDKGWLVFDSGPGECIINMPQSDCYKQLEIGCYPTQITTYDPWFLNIVEERLWEQLKCWTQHEPHENIEAIENFLCIAFDERLDMLPDGSLCSLKTSQEKNRSLTHWIEMMNMGRFVDPTVCLYDLNLKKEYCHPQTKIVWDLSFPGIYSMKDGDDTSAGLIEFKDGKLHFYQVYSSTIKTNGVYSDEDNVGYFRSPERMKKQLSVEVTDHQLDVLSTKELTPKEGKLWFEYLFGPLEVAQTWEKVN